MGGREEEKDGKVLLGSEEVLKKKRQKGERDLKE